MNEPIPPVTIKLSDNPLIMAPSVADYIFNLDMIPVDSSYIHGDFEDASYDGKNSMGYRSPEFTDTDLVLAGCSQTWGVGMPEIKYVWGPRLASMLDAKYVNISGLGWSTEKIVRMVFAYLAKHKNPKYIVCLFPNITRAETIINEDYLKISRGRIPSLGPSETYTKVYPVTYEPYEPGEGSSLSKKPHEVENVNTYENSLRSGMQAINILKLYCQSHGIKFYWSSWDGLFRDLANSLGRDDYVHVDIVKEDGGYFSKDCHHDYAKLCSIFFDIGMDRKHGDFNAHMGAHEHLHYAEAFLDRLKS
jgi:hypothetical protein